MLLSGADIIIKILAEQGVKTVFGYPGSNVLDIYDSLYRYSDEIKHVLTAHEQGAAHAADGFARATGEVGVVISTSGPGATNLVTGIATAYLDSVPMIAICGNVPTTQIATDSFQEVDITGITLPITKHNYFVGSVDILAETVREAFSLASSGRKGPVLIDVPKDVQTALCEFTPAPPVSPATRFSAKDIRIKEAAMVLNKASRPFVYFGGGAVSSDAIDEILALCDKLDCPMACSMMGLSAVDGDCPRFLGMQGMHGNSAATEAMNKADVILALGVRFNDRVTGDRSRFAEKQTVVHIDVDGSELQKNIASAVNLRGDLKETLKALLPLLKEKTNIAWNNTVSGLVRDANSRLDTRSGMTPRNVLNALSKRLNENTAVATDVGQHQIWAAQNLRFKRPRRFISSGGLGTMGFGLGAAIGAAIATGERSVLITGDGSFGMSLAELATAVSYDIPVVILVMNNGALGMVRQWQTLFYDSRYSATTLERKTDFVALARAFGADGASVSTLEELESALDAAFKENRVFVIDCKIGIAELVLPMLRPGGTLDELIKEV